VPAYYWSARKDTSMTIAKIGKITGPPGCGKTTELKRLIDAASDLYFPNEIGVVSYTNAAVEEIRTRIVNTLSEEEKDLVQNVRTLHSHCYRLIGRPPVGEGNLAQFNKERPEFAVGSGKVNPDENIPHKDHSRKSNDKLMNEMNQLRNQLVPPDEWMPDTQAFYKAWSEWLDYNGMVDYTGMIEQVMARKLCPKILILFIDEAQDLTPLQYAVTKLWSENARSTTYAGDSDQCIFRFSGSRPEEFIELDHQWNKHLDQSYRVSPVVHGYGEAVVRQIQNRENTIYKPSDKYGEGKVYTTLYPDLSLEGEHMIICRCNYQINRWIKYLSDQGLLWKNLYRPSNRGWNPLGTQSLETVRIFYTLLSGQEILMSDMQKMVKRLYAKDTMKHGAKGAFLGMQTHEAVGDKMLPYYCDLQDMPSLGFKQSFIDTIQNKKVDEIFKLTGIAAPALIKLPRDIVEFNSVVDNINITIGTIHSIKGGEADHVWLDVGTSPIILKELLRDPLAMYDEARVAYVAVTRARRTLGLLLNYNWNPVLPRI